MSTDNPNNCETCDHFKTQRTIEKADPQAVKLHCYHFREPYPDVCMQHSGRNMNFFGGENFPIQGSIHDMVQSLVKAGFNLDPM